MRERVPWRTGFSATAQPGELRIKLCCTSSARGRPTDMLNFDNVRYITAQQDFSCGAASASRTTQAGAGFGCQQTGSGAGSAPSWLACHQYPRRAGHPADGDGSEKLGTQSYGQRCPHASNIGSVLRTCWQQGKHVFAELVHLQRSARPILLEIIPPTPSP